MTSGVGAKGVSQMQLSGGRGLGPEGAVRLADLLHQAPPLQELDLRRNTLHIHHRTPRVRVR